MEKKFVSIDIGGTNTRIGISENLINIKDLTKEKTPETPDALKKLIDETIGSSFDAAAIAIAGPVDHYANEVTFGTNINALRNGVKLSELFENTSNVYLNNDAEMAGLAEAVFGVGKDYHSVAYITLSTGIGGSLIIDKELPKLRFNMEPGRHIIEIGGIEGYSTKIQGEWEAYSSGTAFNHIYGENPENCTNPEVWERFADELAVGLHNISVLWSPDVIVLGGGLTNKSDYFLPKTISGLKSTLKNVKPLPDIKISNLGDQNVLLGNLAYLKTLESA